jgi:hypothetical protein
MQSTTRYPAEKGGKSEEAKEIKQSIHNGHGEKSVL